MTGKPARLLRIVRFHGDFGSLTAFVYNSALTDFYETSCSGSS